jgi:alpha-galactosidase/6-phospho-beta-glucosidase family protein
MDHLVLVAGNVEKIVAASVEGDRRLLVEALEADPLLGNVDAGCIPEMVGRLLEVNREFVHPGFF